MKRRIRCGFVTTLAVMLIALVAVALAGLTAEVATAARQATAARERAQAEELILAGFETSAGVQGTKSIALPPAIENASLKVSVRGKIVEVEARVGSTRLSQATGE